MPSARTPLFGALRTTVRLAGAANSAGAPPPDELVEIAAASRVSRRDFLRIAGVGAAGASIAACAPAAVSTSGPRVVVVGAGLAGLSTAYHLRRAGVIADVYEASNRTGGRTYTAQDLVGPGTTTELGAEFVDSTHTDILDLMEAFGIEAVDRRETVVGHETYFFDGRHRTIAEIVEAFRPLADRIRADYDSTEDVVDFEHEGNGGALDQMSIAEYLDRIGASGFIRSLLEVAYVTEYGLDVGDQSALNLIFLVGTDLDEGFRIFGDSDERWRVAGGSDVVARRLTDHLEPQIRTGRALEAIRPRGAGYRLTFSGARDVDADAVVLTLPFTMLRRVDVGLPLPDWKRRAIDELGYGMNAKVFAGMRARPWRDAGYSAEAFLDGDVQLCWDPTESQGTNAAGLTIYSGGAAGLASGAGTPEEQVARALPALDAAFPGTTAAYTGTAARFHWPTHPWTLCSYACYRPGQWTTIAGAEIKPVGRLFFAGEHASYDFQGFMNGAAETGRRAASSVLEAVGRPALGSLLRRMERLRAA